MVYIFRINKNIDLQIEISQTLFHAYLHTTQMDFKKDSVLSYLQLNQIGIVALFDNIYVIHMLIFDF